MRVPCTLKMWFFSNFRKDKKEKVTREKEGAWEGKPEMKNNQGLTRKIRATCIMQVTYSAGRVLHQEEKS